CPGNLALLASIVQITLPRKRKTVKYAGNFNPSASQPFSYKWQKRILSNTSLTKNIDVLVYGEWPNQTENIKSFFTATYSEIDKKDFKKVFRDPLQFIFVGTLSPNKNPQLLVELVKLLNNKGIVSQAHFYGDGILMDKLKNESSFFEVMGINGSEKAFHFHGNQPKEIVQAGYKKAHFSFLASQSEGWPKAVAESMWYGCIPIATAVSCIPWMLGVSDNKSLGSRGIIFTDIDNTIATIKQFLNQQEDFNLLSQNAQEWSQDYTLEKFETEIIKLLQS
ncbi:glycosyltransferase, partial [Nonlabens mediterrranea]|nr:glycosyltransferase [Nonlabens mediterrranea]